MKRIAILTCALTGALTINACKKDKKEDKPADTTETAAADTAQKPTETTPPPAETTPPPTEAATTTEPAAPAKPASVTDDQVKLADDFVAAFDATATAAENAKGDCKALAKALPAEAKKVTPLVKKLQEMKAKNEKDEAARDWFKATYEPKVMASFARLKTAVEPCEKDKAVAAALKSIGPTKTKEAAPPADVKAEPPSK
jgi:hypothetical protein